MDWISSEGGPLVVIGKSELVNWQGVDSSDYNRACSVEDYVGLIPVGNSEAIVLGDEPCQTGVVSLNSREVVLARWVYGEDELTVENYLKKLSEKAFNNPCEQIEYQAKDDNFVLFDATLNGESASGVDIALPLDKYVIKTIQYEPDENTFLILHMCRAPNCRHSISPIIDHTI